MIGNTDYADADAPIQIGKADTDLLGETLRDVSFKTDVDKNLGRNAMKAAIAAFLSKITPGSTALFYFQGIGLQVGHSTYLIPVNAQIWTEPDVGREGFSLDALLADMARRGAAVKIVIVDAARANPFERRFRGGPGAGLAAIDAPGETVVAFATAPNKLVRDRGGQVSLFMDNLVSAIRAPDIDAKDAMSRMRQAVAKASAGSEIPWIASSMAVPFSFRDNDGPPRARLPMATAVPHSDPSILTITPSSGGGGGDGRGSGISGGSGGGSAVGAGGDAAPEFPWPPPAPSTSYTLPNTYFAADATMGKVAETITSALEATGYVERRFYALPVAGLALVTRLERMNADGTPANKRWLTGAADQVGLYEMIRGLFLTDPGHYRVIVFLIAKTLPTRSLEDVSITEARAWLKSGLDDVPSPVADVVYQNGHTVAYIYDFVSDGRRFTLDREPLPGRDQLAQAGVLAALGKPRP